METRDLIELTRRGWALPVLAVLGQGVRPRLYAIAQALDGASRAAVLDGVEHLVATGLAARNTGHGHPLRPDLWLTPAGQALAPAAARMWERAGALSARAFVRRRWSLPLLQVLEGPSRFGELRGRLEPITERALSLALQEADVLALVRREVLTDRRPPATLYRPLPAGRDLVAGLGTGG
jgi:DNA-binding HxlR family transcriptional regulator